MGRITREERHYSFRPYREGWNKERFTRRRKSFKPFLFWIAALIVLLALIYYGVTIMA